MKKIIGSVEYEIIENIAEGGMGSVVKALKKGVEGFEKVVAIKTLLDCYSSDKKFVTKFIEEAKLVANLVHENIVQIYQLDKFNGDYYFVLEYVDGVSLYDFIEFHKKIRQCFPENLAVFIAARIARGLAYAHSRCDATGSPLNIVHCDVCPHNIMITTEGLPKLTDFGIARAVNMGDDDSVSGKLPFMSPEQANRQNIDFRSDIYSLGAVLFYMLSSGYTARRLEGQLKDILQQAKDNCIDWTRLPKDTNKDLLVILRLMLDTDPGERYQKTSELARDLEYHIYKDGYGPTIVTLANYMRETMPSLYEPRPGTGKDRDALSKSSVDIDNQPEKTIVLPDEYFQGGKNETTTEMCSRKTVVLP